MTDGPVLEFPGWTRRPCTTCSGHVYVKDSDTSPAHCHECRLLAAKKVGKKLRAKDRTIPMPGVDIGPKDVGIDPLVRVDGPRLRKISSALELHLTSDGRSAICGSRCQWLEQQLTGKVCMACMAKASAMRATIR